MSYNITVGQQIRSERLKDIEAKQTKLKNKKEEFFKTRLSKFETNNQFIKDSIFKNPNKKIKLDSFYEIIDNDTIGIVDYYFPTEGFFKGMLIETVPRFTLSMTHVKYDIYVLADKEYYSEKDIKSSCIIC